ncbi:MAG: c-type cytochrome [Acidobacteria bacterium]|nr:c-type cytochrome [Acidobacteriota bacterium]
MAGIGKPCRCPEEILSKHLFPDLGCTACHRGDRKTRRVKKAHGRASVARLPLFSAEPSTENLDRPFLSGVYVQAACGKCHPGSELPGAPVLSHGRMLFTELGCIACHRLKGHPNDVGVDLTEAGLKDVNRDGRLDLLDRAWLLRHFKDPSAVREGSWMANYKLTDEEATALTVLMLSFTGEALPGRYVIPSNPGPEPKSAVDRGKRVFELWGCAGCHGRGGRGGVRNPNAKGGEIPQLFKLADTIVNDKEEAEKLRMLVESGADIDHDPAAWLDEFRKIKTGIVEGKRPEKEDPKGLPPPLTMPGWREKIQGRDLDYLAVYIMSLFPAEAWESWEDDKPK